MRRDRGPKGRAGEVLLGKCHRCGRALVVHSWFVAEGYQHEEYYCDGCGEFSRGLIPLHPGDPAWRTVYEERQDLIEKGPGDHGRLKHPRDRDQSVREWADRVFDLTQELLAFEANG